MTYQKPTQSTLLEWAEMDRLFWLDPAQYASQQSTQQESNMSPTLNETWIAIGNGEIFEGTSPENIRDEHLSDYHDVADFEFYNLTYLTPVRFKLMMVKTVTDRGSPAGT